MYYCIIALYFHFECHCHLPLIVHTSISLSPAFLFLFHTLCRVTAASSMQGTLSNLGSVVIDATTVAVPSVDGVNFVFTVAFLPHFLWSLINTDDEHLLIDSCAFTSSIVNWKKYIQSNISLIIINPQTPMFC